MKKVMLRIEGIQKSLDGEENVIELTTEGKLYKKENALYLVYEETELSGMQGCTTTLKLLEDKISLKRFGTSHSEIIFEKGNQFDTHYYTPYGDFNMEVLTKDMTYNITDANRGDISIEYHISIEGLVQSTNKLNIKIM